MKPSKLLNLTLICIGVLLCIATSGNTQSPSTSIKKKSSSSHKTSTQPTAPLNRAAIEQNIVNEINDNMVQVEGDTFNIGKNAVYDNEKPTHAVTISSFYISKYEVTQQQWQTLMYNNPSYDKCDSCPVENVSYTDALNFCQRLSVHTGKTFRLPTEAEWEYACSGGNKSKGYVYSGSNNIEEVGWYSRNSNSQLHPVGKKLPNELGLYDMTGNVWEWCSDWYDDNYYKNSVVQDPPGPLTGSARVVRGGSWYYMPLYCRTINRSSYPPDSPVGGTGFRVVVSF